MEGIIKVESFSFCDSLADVTIPASVTNIGAAAFKYCTKLKDVYYLGSEQDWNTISIESNNDPLKEATIHFNDGNSDDNMLTLFVTDTLGNPLQEVDVYCYGEGPYKSDNEGEVKIPIDEPLTDEEAVTDYEDYFSEYSDYALVFVKKGYRTKKYKKFTFPDSVEDLVDVGNNRSIILETPVTSYDGPFSYLSNGGITDLSTDCVYNDSYFAGSNTIYNHDLARMSLSLAMSAFNSSKYRGVKHNVDAGEYAYYYQEEDILNNDEYDSLEHTPACNVADLLYNCGFDDIVVNEDFITSVAYDESLNDGNNIGVCIGNKTLSDGSTLIAVAIRGGGYGCEWIGNFEVWNSDEQHRGFGLAAKKVLTQLFKYTIDKRLIGKNLKIWITGFSRAGCTANLTAAYLCDNGISGCKCDSGDIYAYTFEAPQGTKATNYKNHIYDGIWNIVNPIDAVPKVAMRIWKYHRYGQTVFLPALETCFYTYIGYSNSVQSRFDNLLGYPKEMPDSASQKYSLDILTDGLAIINISDSSVGAQFIQGAMQKIFIAKDYDTNPSENSLETAFKEIFNVVIDVASVAKGTKIGGLASVIKNIRDSINDIIKAHYPELTLAWMNTIPSSAVTKSGVVSYVYNNCPVDLSVYDETGTLQLQIIDNEVIVNDGSPFQALVDDDGQKIIAVPGDVQARIEITATREGEFNYSVHEEHLDDDIEAKLINYPTVHIKEGDTLTGTVSAEDGNGNVEYHLYDEADEVPVETALTGEAADEYHLINVEVVGEGTVTEGLYKKIGEFIQVEATPEGRAEFEGWYEGDNLLSTETVYRHKVTGETTLTAKFKSRILFSDVTDPDEFFYEPIYWAVDNGITTGYKDNTFRPYNNCNRAAVVTFLWRLAGKPDMGITNAFTDMTGNDDFDHAITWAAAEGITTGYKDGTFRPWDTCHRAAIVTFLWRYAGRPEPTSMANFSDMTGNDDFNKAISWAAEKNITTGYNDGTFRPWNQCLRLAVASFLYRYAHL